MSIPGSVAPSDRLYSSKGCMPPALTTPQTKVRSLRKGAQGSQSTPVCALRLAGHTRPCLVAPLPSFRKLQSDSWVNPGGGHDVSLGELRK